MRELAEGVHDADGAQGRAVVEGGTVGACPPAIALSPLVCALPRGVMVRALISRGAAVSAGASSYLLGDAQYINGKPIDRSLSPRLQQLLSPNDFHPLQLLFLLVSSRKV